jgi:hypothetical protein
MDQEREDYADAPRSGLRPTLSERQPAPTGEATPERPRDTLGTAVILAAFAVGAIAVGLYSKLAGAAVGALLGTLVAAVWWRFRKPPPA